MLRTSLCLLLDGLTKKEPLKSDLSNFVKLLKIECQKVKLKNSNHHKRMRMELMLIVFPIRGNTSAEGVDPKTVIDRVCFTYRIQFYKKYLVGISYYPSSARH